ncbi:protein FAM221A isoform X2 [Corvus kubaryi]|uniref:protein FAM221A isoform X2 n=1 Tax=Corvus kubaryi TaxID=68294 RepID=UPI001C044458|nr:protein FAM221A isoform X2 [Corvus kubaryi]
MERLQVDAQALEEYAEYRRIVGDDDGGKLFTPEEYEEYKRKVLPARLQNRLYVSWRSPTGMDCKLVGPETLCFCTHRYKQHKTDYEVLPKERPICVPCRVKRCPCQSYQFVPLNGTQPIRCRCKHFADQHSAAPGFPCNSCAPSAALLEAPITSMDHPFLKAFQGPSGSAQTMPQIAGSARATGQVSHGKQSEADDMAYFEKRYQERLKMEKAAKRNERNPVPSKKP